MKDYKLNNFLSLLDRRGCFIYGFILPTVFLYSSAGISALYGDSQWLIEKGDSVYSIARQVFPDDASKQRQFRQEVVKANPSVFNGNANHMGVGQNLMLPGFAVSKPAPVVTPVVVAAPVVKPVPEVVEPIVESEPVIEVPEVAEEKIVAPDPEEVIGQVVISVGNMQANNRGSFRKLLRHSEILKGDTLTTSERAYTQIRMKDGALISLRPNTELKIIDYHFNGSEDGSERSVMELVSGGFRTITGFIGHVNKQNYRVKTSVATIGIRGTHYGLMVCADGSCNEESASLEDGVYGGVVDGSIVVENDAGKFTFNNDQYFHVATQGQVAVEQLVPPPIFHGKSEKLAAREGADSDVADNGKDEEGQQKNGNSTETRKFKVTVNDEGGKKRRVSRINVQGNVLGEIVRDVQPDIVPLLPRDRDKENVIAVIIGSDTTDNPVLPTSPFPKIPVGTDITLAPNGSGMLIAITDINPQTGIENTSTAAIVVAPTTNNAIGLTTANVGVAVVSNLPVVVHEESAGQVHDLFLPSGAAGIADTGGNAIGVNWGRWAPGFELTEDGLPLQAVGDLHYIYSDKLTSPTQLAALGGLMSTAVYSKVGGTIPTNAAGQQGSLQSLNVTADFINGSILYDLIVTGAGGTSFDMQGVDPTGAVGVAFGEMNEFQLNPTSPPSCVGCVGNASAAFVGSQAEGIITTYSVQDSTGDGVNGAELLTRP